MADDKKKKKKKAPPVLTPEERRALAEKQVIGAGMALDFRDQAHFYNRAAELLGRMPDAVIGGFHFFELTPGPDADRLIDDTGRALLAGETATGTPTPRRWSVPITTATWHERDTQLWWCSACFWRCCWPLGWPIRPTGASTSSLSSA